MKRNQFLTKLLITALFSWIVIAPMAQEDQQKTKEEGPYWGVGFGMGTFLVNGNKMDLNLEGLSYQINEDEWWTDKTNMLVRLNLNLQYHLSPRLSVVAGASNNLAISQLKDAEGRVTGGTFIPGMTFFDHTGKKTRTAMYPGVNFGFQYRIR